MTVIQKREVIKEYHYRTKKERIFHNFFKTRASIEYSINFSNKHGIKYGTSNSRGKVHMQ